MRFALPLAAFPPLLAESDGDAIVVLPGTSVGTINFLGRDIRVVSRGVRDVATIDGNGAAVDGDGTLRIANSRLRANATVDSGGALFAASEAQPRGLPRPRQRRRRDLQPWRVERRQIDPVESSRPDGWITSADLAILLGGWST
jgi:hypothetical protein